MSNRKQHTVNIDADINHCYEILIDYENIPNWHPSVLYSEVLEVDSEGRGHVVEYEVDAQIKKARYTLRYTYEQPERIVWEYVEGDPRNIEGEYRFNELEDGTTEVTYELEIDPGRFVPGPIKTRLTEEALKQTLERFKEHAEATT